MINDAIISHWSNAFFQLIVEEKKVKEYRHQAVILIELLEKYPEFLDIIDSSILPFSEKSKIIKITFTHFSHYMINFFLLLAEENSFRYSLRILKEFRKQCNVYYGIQYGVIYSVIKLSAEQINKLEKKVEILINNKVELVNKIDKNLIAGIKINVKNQIWDGSVKGKIDQLRNNLLRNNQE